MFTARYEFDIYKCDSGSVFSVKAPIKAGASFQLPTRHRSLFLRHLDAFHTFILISLRTVLMYFSKMILKKIKQSHYRPGVALRVPGS